MFRAVQHGEAAHGVVPFENSTNGSVIFTLDHLADKHNWYPDVHVEAEIYLAVEHVLAGFIAKSTSSEEDQKTDKTSRMSQPWRRVDSKDTNDTVADSDKADKGQGKASEDNEDAPPTPRANQLQANLTTSPATAPEPEALAAVEPLHDISHIKTVHSHPQAWGQCVRFWNTYLKGSDQHDSTATSRAALEVAKGGDPSHAAICSRLAAKGYGLDILADGIQDDRGNCTRFLVLRSNKSKISPISSPPANSLEVIELVSPPLPPPLPPANSVPGNLQITPNLHRLAPNPGSTSRMPLRLRDTRPQPYKLHLSAFWKRALALHLLRRVPWPSAARWERSRQRCAARGGE